MDWTTIMAALQAWVTAGTGLSQVVWQSDRQPFNQKALGLLSLASVETEGHDELTFEEVGVFTPIPVAPSVVGQRILSIQVAVLSYVHEPTLWAPHYAELLRTKVFLPSLMTILNDAGLAFVDVGPLAVTNTEADDYLVNQASFILRVRASFCLDPEEQTSIETIDSVEVTTEISDADGVLLPSDLQLTEEEIPE